jgi:hypothetical protein
MWQYQYHQHDLANWKETTCKRDPHHDKIAIFPSHMAPIQSRDCIGAKEKSLLLQCMSYFSSFLYIYILLWFVLFVYLFSFSFFISFFYEGHFALEIEGPLTHDIQCMRLVKKTKDSLSSPQRYKGHKLFKWMNKLHGVMHVIKWIMFPNIVLEINLMPN